MGQLRGLVLSFAEETTAHGVKRVFTSRSLAARVFWLLVFLGSLAFVSNQGYKLVTKYRSYPTEVDIQLSTGLLPFPAITICNKNPYRASQLIKYGVPMEPSEWDDWADEDDYSESGSGSGDGLTTDDSAPSTTTPEDTTGEESSSRRTDEADELAPTVEGGGDREDEDASLVARTRAPRRVERGAEVTEADDEIYSAAYDEYCASIQNDTTQYCLDCPELCYEGFEPKDDDVDLVGFWLLVNSRLNSRTKPLAGHQLFDLVQSCTWRGRSCQIQRVFTQRHYPVFGNCFTFNSGMGRREVKTLGLTGFLKGLTLVLFLEQPEYVGELSHSSGIRLVVHEAGRTPFPMEEGIDLSPGVETSIGVRAEIVERAKPPHGSCTDGEEENKNSIFANSSYSSKSCEMNCLTQSMLSACGCVHPLYGWSELKQTDICRTPRGVDCTNNIIYNPPLCSCRQPCHGVNYVYEASMSSWPSEVYQKLFLNDLKSYTKSTSVKNWIEDFVDEDGDTYIELSRANFAKINVYFQTLNYEQIITQPSYEMESLLGDLGGQLGLWVGFSIMTCVEFVELLITMATAMCGRRKGSAASVREAQDLSTLGMYSPPALSAKEKQQIQDAYRKHSLDLSPLKVSLPARQGETLPRF